MLLALILYTYNPFTWPHTKGLPENFELKIQTAEVKNRDSVKLNLGVRGVNIQSLILTDSDTGRIFYSCATEKAAGHISRFAGWEKVDGFVLAYGPELKDGMMSIFPKSKFPKGTVDLTVVDDLGRSFTFRVHGLFNKFGETVYLGMGDPSPDLAAQFSEKASRCTERNKPDCSGGQWVRAVKMYAYFPSCGGEICKWCCIDLEEPKIYQVCFDEERCLLICPPCQQE